jgi:hypothetical protein
VCTYKASITRKRVMSSPVRRVSQLGAARERESLLPPPPLVGSPRGRCRLRVVAWEPLLLVPSFGTSGVVWA